MFLFLIHSITTVYFLTYNIMEILTFISNIQVLLTLKDGAPIFVRDIFFLSLSENDETL